MLSVKSYSFLPRYKCETSSQFQQKVFQLANKLVLQIIF